MAYCRVCSAPITWAVDTKGNKVPIDDHEEMDRGPGRYRILETRIEPLIEAISEESPLRTHCDHRVLCQQPRAI